MALTWTIFPNARPQQILNDFNKCILYFQYVIVGRGIRDLDYKLFRSSTFQCGTIIPPQKSYSQTELSSTLQVWRCNRTVGVLVVSDAFQIRSQLLVAAHVCSTLVNISEWVAGDCSQHTCVSPWVLSWQRYDKDNDIFYDL